jgi:hypothetical protein
MYNNILLHTYQPKNQPLTLIPRTRVVKGFLKTLNPNPKKIPYPLTSWYDKKEIQIISQEKAGNSEEFFFFLGKI